MISVMKPAPASSGPVPLHHVKEMLGHANISQTDTYLNAGRVALRESMQRIDTARRGKRATDREPAC